MSNSAINWAITLKIDPTAKHVLTVMANRADESKKQLFNRPIGQLIEETSRNRTTILWCLRYLVETELITRLTPNGVAFQCQLNVGSQPKADVPKQRRAIAPSDSSPVAPSDLSHRPTCRTVRQDLSDAPTAPIARCDSPSHSPIRRTKEPITKGNIREKKTRGDSRHADFVAWLFAEHPGITLLPKDFRALKVLLDCGTRITQEQLREYWTRFVHSPIPFHQQNRLSLAFFVSRFNTFETEQQYGNQRETTGEAAERFNREQFELVRASLDAKANSGIRRVGSGSTVDDLRGSSE